jgi:serine/threonine-protein kinase
MGEVYRADDLKLGQPVALKFLPKRVADDPGRRVRFYDEVRIARQVTHRNICRVHDIAEFNHLHFITMEYVDGEDLASLLKRIGKLHGAKALDIARQLCSGLAAAHDKSVLHRDMKPANVMIDGCGQVRITDFGLAISAGENAQATEVSGTPAYMAPEQFCGEGASVLSDIYGLGMVLYELYTGRRAFAASTLAELVVTKANPTPMPPSEIVPDIDPMVERVILRCLDRDPLQRPASVSQVLAALPAGAPIIAMIAAGVTPSPEMVAAAGEAVGMRPAAAVACLTAVIAGLILCAYLGGQVNWVAQAMRENSPDILAARARDIISRLGYPDPPADSAAGLAHDLDSLQYLRQNRQLRVPSDRLARSRPAAVYFWYRESQPAANLARPRPRLSTLRMTRNSSPHSVRTGSS